MPPRGYYTIYSKVQNLIDPISAEWDEELIRSIFWPINAQVLSILLSLYGGAEDFVASKYTNNACFTVHSAFHMEVLCTSESSDFLLENLAWCSSMAWDN